MIENDDNESDNSPFSNDDLNQNLLEINVS